MSRIAALLMDSESFLPADTHHQRSLSILEYPVAASAAVVMTTTICLVCHLPKCCVSLHGLLSLISCRLKSRPKFLPQLFNVVIRQIAAIPLTLTNV